MGRSQLCSNFTNLHCFMYKNLRYKMCDIIAIQLQIEIKLRNKLWEVSRLRNYSYEVLKYSSSILSHHYKVQGKARIVHLCAK